jgi:hypothetical protein
MDCVKSAKAEIDDKWDWLEIRLNQAPEIRTEETETLTADIRDVLTVLTEKEDKFKNLSKEERETPAGKILGGLIDVLETKFLDLETKFEELSAIYPGVDPDDINEPLYRFESELNAIFKKLQNPLR